MAQLAVLNSESQLNRWSPPFTKNELCLCFKSEEFSEGVDVLEENRAAKVAQTQSWKASPFGGDLCGWAGDDPP